MLTIKKERFFSIINYGFADSLGRLFKIAFLPILAWYMTPSDYGEISLFLSLTVFGTVLVSFNFTNYIRHITLTRLKNRNSYISTIYFSVIIFGTISSFIFYYHEYLRNIIWFSLCLTIQTGAASYYLALEKRIMYLVFTSIVNFIGYALPLVIIYLKGLQNFDQIIDVVILFQVIITLGVLLYLVYKNIFRLSYFRLEYLIELSKLNAPLVLNSLSGIGLIYIDRIFIKSYHGYAVLGQYTYVYNSYLLYGLMIQAIINDFIPKYYYIRNEENYKRSEDLLEDYKMYSIIFIPAAIIIYLFLVTYKPNDYSIDEYVFAILACGAVFQYLYSLTVNKLHYVEQTTKVFKSTLFAFVINIVLNFLLVPRFDQVGAAIATLFGYLTLYVYTRKYAFRV